MSGTTIELDGRWEKCEAALDDGDWHRMCIELGIDPAKVNINAQFLLMENRATQLIYLHGLVRYPGQASLKASYNDCHAKEVQMVARITAQ